MMSEKVPIGFKCKKCGQLHYPRHGRCLNCKHSEFQEIDLPTEGNLVTYTILKAPPTGIDRSLLYLGIVDLGEVNYTGQIEVDDPSNLKIGMKLKATWKQVRKINGKPVYGFVWVN
jgi:uncharacterized OB-fold protein